MVNFSLISQLLLRQPQAFSGSLKSPFEFLAPWLDSESLQILLPKVLEIKRAVSSPGTFQSGLTAAVPKLWLVLLPSLLQALSSLIPSLVVLSSQILIFLMIGLFR